MEVLKTTNEYENGKPKKAEFNPFKLEFVDVAMVCPKHGKVLAKVLQGHEEKPYCPMCAKEEEERQKAEEERLRLEREQQEIQEQYKERNIEPEYWGKTLEDYIIKTESQRTAYEATKQLIERKTGKLILLGSNGVGKTLLGSIAVNALGGKILSMYEIETLIRQSYSAKADKTELEIVNELASMPMLVIDELGRTKGSTSSLNWLSYVLDKRHTRDLPYALLSNKHLNKDCPKGGCEDCFENYVNNDVISRLRQNSKIITIVAPDFRATKRSV